MRSIMAEYSHSRVSTEGRASLARGSTANKRTRRIMEDAGYYG